MRPLGLLVACFLWLGLPLGLYAGYHVYGAPHVIWSYKWFDEGQGFDPFARRYYTACVFIGPQGPRRFEPISGKCGLVRFAKLDGGMR